MAFTPEELLELNYRQVQAECKAQGIGAKGTKAELVGRLIQKLQNNEAKATPIAKAARPTQRPGSTSAAGRLQPPAATPPPRKSIVRSTVLKALSTPLPASPPRAAPPAAQRRRSGLKPFALGALLAVLIAVLTAAALPYCQRTDCAALAREVPTQAAAWMQKYAEQAHVAAERHSVQALAAARHAASILRSHSSQAYEAAGVQLHALRGMLQQGGGAGQQSALFDGRLDPAALEAVVPASEGGAQWANLRDTLAHVVWPGAKINDNKANVVLFVCGSDEVCAYAAEHLAAAAPADSVLALNAGEVGADRGALQKRLASFLKEEPRGVVLLKNVDKLPPSLVPVLSNGMGEGGAFEQGGRSVLATGATFILTWKVPAAILAEDTEAGLSLAAKKTLAVDFARGGSEEAAANAQAFRRRIDLVAPVLG